MYVGRCNTRVVTMRHDKKECRVSGGQAFGILLHFSEYIPPVFVLASKCDLDRKISHSSFRSVQFSCYNSNQRMHPILLKSQYYNTPAVTCFGLTASSSGSTQCTCRTRSATVLCNCMQLGDGPMRPKHVGASVI
jgi:hypothetical protein